MLLLFIISFIVIIAVILILLLLFKKKWPVNFYLTNKSSSPINFELFVNGFDQGQQTILAGQKFKLNIGSNMKNSRTNQGITREQLNSIAIYFKDQPKIYFERGNLPSNYQLILSKDITGLGPINPNNPNPGENWSEIGFYVINLDIKVL